MGRRGHDELLWTSRRVVVVSRGCRGHDGRGIDVWNNLIYENLLIFEPFYIKYLVTVILE